MAAVDYFLKLDGIDGESTDDKHKDWIEIDSFSWGLGQADVGDASSRAGAAAGKVSIQDFNFSKRIDKSSPILMLSCASGKHMKEGILIGMRGGEKPQEYLVIKMTDILISSYQTGGSSGDVLPVDSFSLNFAKIEFTYTPQDERGGAGKPVSASWDVKANK